MPAFPSAEEVMTSQQPQVPQAQGGFNAGQELDRILSSNQAELAKLSTAAFTPVPAGHANQVPATMTTPSVAAPGQLDHREVVGAGNAKAQGIGNSAIAVMNLLGGVKTTLDNKQKMKVATATQQLLTAQQGMDQAMQVLKTDPNNADAKAAVERNKGVMNTILSDDKMRKQIAKGFNVDFTDPKANDTIEHAGVAEGKKMAQQHADYASQFNQKTPTQMGFDPLAQQKYAAAVQQRQDMIKIYAPLALAQAKFTNQQAVQKAGQIFRARLSYANAIKDFALQKQRAAATSDEETKRFNHAVTLQAQGQYNRLQALDHAIAMHSQDPIKIAQLLGAEDAKYQQEKETWTARRSNLEGQITSLVQNKQGGDPRVQELRNQIKGMENDFQSLDKSHAEATKYIRDLIQQGQGSSGSGVPISSAARVSGEATGGGADIDEVVKAFQSLEDGEPGAFDPASEDPSSYMFSNPQ